MSASIRTVALILLGVSTAMGADMKKHYMQTHTIQVCGAQVSFDLHPSVSAEAPASKPRNVTEGQISKPGSMNRFAGAMYDYRRAWHWNVDANLVVDGSVIRRPDVLREMGVSDWDLEACVQLYRERMPDHQSEIVERAGSQWIRRVKINDVPAGRGRSVELEWLVPLAEDIMLVFSVELHDYALGNPKFYPQAKAMQDWIFESLKVDLSPEAESNRQEFIRRNQLADVH